MRNARRDPARGSMAQKPFCLAFPAMENVLTPHGSLLDFFHWHIYNNPLVLITKINKPLT